MDEKNILKKTGSIKQLALGMAIYSGASIFGPLVFFILLGLTLDKYFETKPIFLLSGVAVAFVFTNLLLFKRIKALNKKFKEQDEKEKNKSENEKSSSDIIN